MALGDFFSDSNERDARTTLRKAYTKGHRIAKRQLKSGFEDLEGSYADALGNIEDTSRGARRDIAGGMDDALGYYTPYSRATRGAADLYSDALGLGGEGGDERAVRKFQTSPGFDFAMDTGLTAIDRRAASRGMLGSGNTNIDTINYAQGLANQEYGNWLDRLRGQQEFGANIAGAKAGLRTGAAKDISAIREAGGTRSAAINTGLGDVRYGLGENLADLGYATRLGRAGIQADFLNSKDDSGSNIFGALTGGLSLGAKLLGV